MGKSIRSKIKRKHRAVKATEMEADVLAHKNRLHQKARTIATAPAKTLMFDRQPLSQVGSLLP